MFRLLPQCRPLALRRSTLARRLLRLRHGSRRALRLGVVAAVLAVAACHDNKEGGPSPSPGPVLGETVSYTAVGASDAIGIGSSVPCVPFTPCPDGRGYVPSVARELERQGRTVTLTNLGVPGAVLSPAIQALGNQYGRGIPGNFL